MFVHDVMPAVSDEVRLRIEFDSLDLVCSDTWGCKLRLSDKIGFRCACHVLFTRSLSVLMCLLCVVYGSYAVSLCVLSGLSANLGLDHKLCIRIMSQHR